MNKPGPLTKQDRDDIRAYQKTHGLKIDGKPGHETVPDMLGRIDDLSRKFNAAKMVAVFAVLCVGLVLWLGMGW